MTRRDGRAAAARRRGRRCVTLDLPGGGTIRGQFGSAPTQKDLEALRGLGEALVKREAALVAERSKVESVEIVVNVTVPSSPPSFRPSEVVLEPVPFRGTWSGSVALAAAVLVRACCRMGDMWQAVGPKEAGDCLTADIEERVEPFTGLAFNMKPNVIDLVRAGFARFVGDHPVERRRAVEFTEAGFAALERWVRRTS